MNAQFYSLVRFELDYNLRRPFFYIAFGAFFLLAFIATAGNFDVIGDGTHYPVNAPFHINSVLIVCNLLGLFLVTAFASNPMLRDKGCNIAQLLFAMPLRPRGYFLGRMSGATLVTLLAFSGAFAGMLLGAKMPWLAADLTGDTNWSAYWFTLYAIVLPNFLVTIALTFSVAAMTCKAMPTYLSAVVFIMFQFASRTLNSPELVQIGALLDPFGIAAVLEQTRYWVIEERQNRLLELSGTLLHNRLIWLSVAA
ncbi:MAG: hypothetical protein MJK04_23630, partial [Psychrosphaera sp.]|nr:hypothetical protein [Psychrosphaera sp.]